MKTVEEHKLKQLKRRKTWVLLFRFQFDLKFDKHIKNCTNKANRTPVIIKHTSDYLDKDMLIILYKSLVRPLLENATCVWTPYLKKHIREVENVQKRATKFIASITDPT